MRTSKRSEPQGPDRLSELPDSVIFHILWFVPMIDVIRTAVLSKRWRNLRNITPCLNFVAMEVGSHDENGDPRKDDYFTNQFRNLVNRALIFWNGERILKFKIDSSDHLEKSIHDDIDMWLLFAKKNKVEELYLHLHCERISSVAENLYFDDGKDVYWATNFLGSWSSLKVLSFRQCNVLVYKNVQWNQLKSLTITESLYVTDHLVNRILSGSPRLEVFVLSFADRGASLSIESRSLKKLSIYKFLYDRSHVPHYFAPNKELWMGTKLRIKTPNLESLEIKGIPYGDYLLIDVSSLTHATLGFYGLHFLDRDHDDDHEHSFTSIDFLGERYIRIFSIIQHVEHVTLYYCCIKVLGAMKKRCIHSSFPNVKSLQIGYCFNDYEQLGVLLESFPQLKTLVLQAREEDEKHDEGDSVKFDSESHLKFCEAILPNSFLLQLRTVEVTWAEGDNIFPFIEIVLKHARKLEKVVFRVKGIKAGAPPSKSLLLASQELCRMPRSSPNCRIHTIPYVFKS